MDVYREMVVATSPKNVWRALTNAHDLRHWAGDPSESTTECYVLSGHTVFGGQMGGTVLQRREEQTLKFQWILAGLPTEVTIHIKPESHDGGTFTRVVVEHRNVPEEVIPSAASQYPQASFDVSWVLWLRHLALWAERAVVTGQFNYAAPLSAIVEQSVVIEADVNQVWRYITDPDLRKQWFDEPMGAEIHRIDHSQVTFAWIQDSPGSVTFHVEPMPGQRTLVLVHHEGLNPSVLFDYHIGWQDYLVSLVRRASRPLIRQTIWINAGPEQVWRWFTSQDTMRQWWNPSTVYEPRVGGRMAFTDHGSELHGLVTELTAPTRFAFSFVERGTEGHRHPYIVAIDLEPEDNGTRVYITQSGFDALPADIRDRVFVGYQFGWAESPELDRLALVASRAVSS